MQPLYPRFFCRYSNADVGCDYPVTTPFFHQWSTTCSDEVRILRISVGIDNKNIQVDEGSRSVLKYKTPHFRYHLCDMLFVSDHQSAFVFLSISLCLLRVSLCVSLSRCLCISSVFMYPYI